MIFMMGWPGGGGTGAHVFSLLSSFNYILPPGGDERVVCWVGSG